MGLKERLPEQAAQEEGLGDLLWEQREQGEIGEKREKRENIDKELQVKQETSLDVGCWEVCFWEYEDAAEGDFVKVCAEDTETGVPAEYAWCAAKYPGAVRTRQRLTRMTLNGTEVRCDILTLQLPDGGTRNVYFDISSFFGKRISLRKYLDE